MEGREHALSLVESDQPLIMAFWHSRLMIMPIVPKKLRRKLAVMVSDNRHGDISARVIAQFDVVSRRGSSANPRKKEKNKGGSSALRAMVKDAKSGMNTGITPDGPRGPANEVKMGVVQLARLTGHKMLPISVSVRHAIRLKSWDRLVVPIPVPFSQGVIVFGEPVELTDRSPEGMEQARLLLEQRIIQVTNRADELAGLKQSDRIVHPTQGMAVTS